MGPVKESAVPEASKAAGALRQAMDNWDEAATDAAIAGLVRSAKPEDVFEMLFNSRAPGLPLYWAQGNLYRQCPSDPSGHWLAARRASAAVAGLRLLATRGRNPSRRDAPADLPGRRNRELGKRLRIGWQAGRRRGALTAAFIPIFKEKEKTHGEIEMWRTANAVISELVIAATAVIGVAMLGISIALNVHAFDANTELMLRLLRMMFPYMLLVCLAAALVGMLNARGHFFIPAMGATMLNVVMIASVLWLAPKMGHDLREQIFALAIGVLAAGVAQAAFQLPTLWHDGFRYRWVSPWKNETVHLVVTRMIPGALGVAAFPINVLLTQTVAFYVDPQINASFDYAVRLMELQKGIIG